MQKCLTISSIQSRWITFLGFVCLGMLSACAQSPNSSNKNQNSTQNKEEIKVSTKPETKNMETKLDTATLGAGCFWCVEAVFQRLNGVQKVISGYSGGNIKNPSYREVCMGTTGHAEVAQLIYNPTEVSFAEILEVFWKTHDPTTLNQQGADRGTQYRSAIFYHNEEQKLLAEKYKAELNKSGAYDAPVVTEISAFVNFYPAEDYHQNYYNLNGGESYCRYVIQPKVEKFEKVFKDKLKK
jgi:peptide-methionine (S)-S-oxide reductase